MYKFISISIKSIIVLLVLIHIAIYATYLYHLKDVNFSKYKALNLNYQPDVYTTLWVSFIKNPSKENINDIKMKKTYPIFDMPFHLIYYNNLQMYNHPSYRLAHIISNNIVIKRRRVFKRLSLATWITHHLSFNNASDLFFQKMYYGQKIYGLQKASRSYFNKTVNELNIYEIIMLQAITYSPSGLNPKRHPQKLLKKMNNLIEKMKKTFPLQYTHLVVQKKLSKFL